ncbi:MAG: hypothetical protein KBG76_16410, partial [Saprospiraceae bacterium]|nr:hypothetical protein [Saprospiraceae bacterium]
NGWEVNDHTLLKIVALYKERVYKVNEIAVQAAYFFEEPQHVDPEAIQKHWRPELKGKIKQLLAQLHSFGVYESGTLEASTKEMMKELALKPGEVFPLFRLGLCGSLQGPTVFQMLEVLEQDGLTRIGLLMDSLP